MSDRKAGRVEAGGSQAQAWLHANANVLPGTLTGSPPWVRGVFDHGWAPMTALAQQARCLPNHVWEFLDRFPGGFVAISTQASRYVPGPAAIGGQQRLNVAYVSVQDLAHGTKGPLHVIGHLIDHYLGCGGGLDGRWLSEGGSVEPRWQQAGKRLTRLFALGYAVDEVAQSGLPDYFAQSLAWYCQDKRHLNVADPQICKWFRSTLWAEAFWRLAEQPLGE